MSSSLCCHARSYAEWGVDYLKYDFCGMEKHRDETARTAYARMRDALTKATATTGRPILYSLCSWGSGSPHRWGAAVSNSWRTGRDMFAVWDAQGVKDLALPGYMQSVAPFFCPSHPALPGQSLPTRLMPVCLQDWPLRIHH